MYEREPLILTTLKHPIKFIWRFLLMLSVMRWVFAFIAHNIEFLNFIYNFTDKSRFEYNIFFILVVYLTMRLVRSNVEEEMYNPKPKPEPLLMKPDSSFVEEIANAHRARQAQKEARERAHHQAQMDTMYQFYHNQSREAYYNGDSQAEEYYSNRADSYKHM